MGRCKILGSLKSFLWYAPQLSGANILCFTSWVSWMLTGSHWRSAITNDCGILCLLIQQEIFHFSLPSQGTPERKCLWSLESDDQGMSLGRSHRNESTTCKKPEPRMYVKAPFQEILALWGVTGWEPKYSAHPPKSQWRIPAGPCLIKSLTLRPQLLR